MKLLISGTVHGEGLCVGTPAVGHHKENNEETSSGSQGHGPRPWGLLHGCQLDLVRGEAKEARRAKGSGPADGAPCMGNSVSLPELCYEALSMQHLIRTPEKMTHD